MKKLICLLIIQTIFCAFAYSKEGTVILLKGKALFRKAGGKSSLLKKGDKIVGNGIIKTGKKSFVRIKFKDKSMINLGRDSSIALSQSDPKKPKVLEILKGKVRGYVNKKAKPKPGFKEKLYIKTRTASMGIRGTDFFVVYNKENHITSSLTFSGDVRMYKKPDEEILDEIREEMDSKKKVHFSQGVALNELADDLKHHSTTEIGKGEFSGAYLSYEKPTRPTKISPVQSEILKVNQKADFDRKGKVIKNGKKLKNVVNKNSTLVPEPRSNSIAQNDYNSKSADGRIKPGGILDVETGIYVSPPEGAEWDPKSKTYKMPDDFGGIDASTGAYRPPNGLKLDPLKGFVAMGPKYTKDRNIQKSLKKLQNLSGSFSDKFMQTINIFKEITRMDVKGVANYRYTTNVMENYFGEYRFISGIESMIVDAKAFAGFQLYHSRDWLIYPKAHVKSLYAVRSQFDDVSRNDSIEMMLGWENHYKHSMFGKKARFVVDIEFKTRYQDYKNSGDYDFYVEDTGVKFSEKFQFNHKNTTELYYQVRAYAGYQGTEHGNIHNYGALHRYNLNPNWDFMGGIEYSERRHNNFGLKYRIYRGLGKLIWLDPIPRTEVHFSYTYEYHHTDAYRALEYGRYYNNELLFNYRLGNFWKVNALYGYRRMRAVPVDRSFIDQTVGGGLTMVF